MTLGVPRVTAGVAPPPWCPCPAELRSVASRVLGWACEGVLVPAEGPLLPGRQGNHCMTHTATSLGPSQGVQAAAAVLHLEQAVCVWAARAPAGAARARLQHPEGREPRPADEVQHLPAFVAARGVPQLPRTTLTHADPLWPSPPHHPLPSAPSFQESQRACLCASRCGPRPCAAVLASWEGPHRAAGGGSRPCG